MLIWIGYYVLVSLFSWWLISGGGAEKLAELGSTSILSWLSAQWNAEQIKLYTGIVWIFFSLLFIYGLFNPQFRDEYFLYFPHFH